MAKNQGLDLIEIAPNANPPVCKIMDMGNLNMMPKKKQILQKKTKNYCIKRNKNETSNRNT